jgi:hypothetical protein
MISSFRRRFDVNPAAFSFSARRWPAAAGIVVDYQHQLVEVMVLAKLLMVPGVLADVNKEIVSHKKLLVSNAVYPVIIRSQLSCPCRTIESHQQSRQ